MKNKKVIAELMICIMASAVVMAGCGSDKTKSDSETAAKEIDVIQKGETMSGDSLDTAALQSVTADVSFYDNVGTMIETVPVESVLTGTETTSAQVVQQDASIYLTPTEDSQVVATVVKNTTLTVYGDADSNGFVKVDYNGHVCYIQSDVLTKTTDNTSTTTNNNNTNDSDTSEYSGSSYSNNSYNNSSNYNYSGGSSSGGGSSDSSSGGGSSDSSSGGSSDSGSGGGSSDSGSGGGSSDSGSGGGSSDSGSSDSGSGGGSSDSGSGGGDSGGDVDSY